MIITINWISKKFSKPRCLIFDANVGLLNKYANQKLQEICWFIFINITKIYVKIHCSDIFYTFFFEFEFFFPEKYNSSSSTGLCTLGIYFLLYQVGYKISIRTKSNQKYLNKTIWKFNKSNIPYHKSLKLKLYKDN